jgi:uncharacterized protein (TIGR03663 family)
MSRRLALGLLLAVAAALALRLPHLDRRPLHNDEATNATKLAALWEHGSYRYDPDEYHGPFLYYAALPFLWLSPARTAADLSDATLRLVTVAFGVALILLLPLLADGLGRAGALCAAAFTALSPALVFYSRYFIHEMALVFATLLLLAAGWRYAQTRRAAWAALAGAGLGLMHATKETFVIALGALALALAVTCAWEKGRRGALSALRAWWNARHAAVFVAVAAVVSVTLFTSFFTNASGPLDSLRSYLPWLHRAGGHSPHLHPWHFYFERLLWFHAPRGPVWSEAFVLALAAVGAGAAFTGKGLPADASRAFARFLALYSLILAGAYSAIAYKTPWCLLGFWHGLVLLAGVGVAVLWQTATRRRAQAAAALALAAGAAHLGWQAWRAGVDFAADRRNPYVYAQTDPSLRELVQRVEAIAQVHPQGRQMLVKVIAPESYWPLPWYLRRFPRTGWWDALPADPYAPVMIVSARLGAALDDRSGKTWLMTGLYELRPGVFLELYVQFDLWKKFVETLPGERE